MDEIQRLLDTTFPFINELLVKYGEFFPLASAIDTNGHISQVGTYDGTENPLSDRLINDFKDIFRAKKDKFDSIAIFYDVRVVNPKTRLKTDAVAVFSENKKERTSYIFYFPYSLTTDKKLSFSDSWMNTNDMEIFID